MRNIFVSHCVSHSLKRGDPLELFVVDNVCSKIKSNLAWNLVPIFSFCFVFLKLHPHTYYFRNNFSKTLNSSKMSTTGSKNSCNQCPQQWLISQFGQLSLNLHIIIMYLHFPSRTGSNNRIFVLNKRINNPKIPQKISYH